jgi:hypothetical protein
MIRLEDTRDYQILTPQNTAALETQVSADGIFRGSLRIRDPEGFWRGGKFLVILAR